MRSSVDNYLIFKNKFPVNTIIKHKNCCLEEKIIDYKYDLFDVYVKLDPINYRNWEYRKKPRWFYISILREYEVLERI